VVYASPDSQNSLLVAPFTGHNGYSTSCVFIVIPLSAWADNADYLAKQYAGTGALKTDFTRFVVVVVSVFQQDHKISAQVIVNTIK